LNPVEPEGEALAETRAEMIPLDLAGPPGRQGDGAFQSPSFEARLRVEQGSVDEQMISLDRPVTIIGRRQQGSDVVIHDTNVSRQHAKIQRLGDRVTIEDSDSSNGTIVNDERIEAVQELRPGDVIRIGDAVFVFEKVELDDDLGSPEGSTRTIDLDSPMTSLGGAPELVPPGLISGQLNPLTPPPSMMDPRHTALADSFSNLDPEPEPGRSATPPPATSIASSAHDVLSEPPIPAGGQASSAALSPSSADYSAASRPSSPANSSTSANMSGGSSAPRSWASQSQSGPPPSSGSATSNGGSDSLDGLRRELNEVGGELLTFAGSLNGLADRVERLEQALDSASTDLDRITEAVRGPDATVLRELQGILSEIESDTDARSLDEAMRVLGQLSAQPRDIELLLKLSQQASALESALRIHGRLVAIAPRVRASLARLVS